MWLEHRVADLRYAVRMIWKAKVASTVAILSLALGIGANTAVFSIVDALLLKSLPVRDPQQLFHVARVYDRRQVVSWNYPDYCAYRAGSHSFTGLAAYGSALSMGMQVVGEKGANAEVVAGSMVSGNFFDVLGVEPSLGRLFNPADEGKLGGAPYVVLANDYWQHRFGADPRIIGRTLRVNGYPLTIVGVARRGFKGLDVAAPPNLFIPIAMQSQVMNVAPGVWNSRHYWWLRIVGRLAPDANLARAEAEITTINKSQEETERRATPRAGLANAGQRIILQPASRGWSGVRNTLEKPLIVLFVVVALVLLIACANIASLMLARGTARQREMAVRAAVGAGRSRLAMQMLVESTVLALLGGVTGLAFAYTCVHALLRFLPNFSGPQTTLDISPDVRLLAFTFIVSLVTGVLFGLAPAVQATRAQLVPALKESGAGAVASRRRRLRSRFTLRNGLVVGQVALSILLLLGGGLFVRTLENLRNVDTGFSHEETTIVRVDPSRNAYKGQRLRAFYDTLRDDASGIPGVKSATLAFITPLSGMTWDGDVSFEAYERKPDEPVDINLNAVGPRYFETLGIPIVHGRDFVEADNPPVMPDEPQTIEALGDEGRDVGGHRVAIITRGIAKKFFAGRNPIGMHLCLGGKYDPSKAYEVVGVVGDVRYEGLRRPAELMVYVPTWNMSGAGVRTLCLRTTGPAAPVVEAVRRRVTALDAGVPVLSVRTLRQDVDNNLTSERLVATLCGFFGLLALLLVGVGLYGVISYGVSRRTREIGIRMALGAKRSTVVQLVVGDAVLLVCIGAAIGLPVALWLTQLVKAFLFGVTTQDPVAIVATIVLLFAVAAFAALVPARRATSIAPTEALRCE